MLNGWNRKVRITSAMMSAWTITRAVSAMPPSLRLVPMVSLIFLWFRPVRAPRDLLSAGRAACNERLEISRKRVLVIIHHLFQQLGSRPRVPMVTGTARPGAQIWLSPSAEDRFRGTAKRRDAAADRCRRRAKGWNA